MPFVGEHTRTECIAQDHFPFNRRVRPLEYNMMNLSVGRNPLGSAKSRSQLLHTLRLMDFDDLRPIIGTLDDPKLPSFWERHPFRNNQKFLLLRKTFQGQNNSTYQSELPARIMAAADVLRQCPREHTSWMTIVTSPCLTYEDALMAAEKDAERLERMFRARHPHGIMAITAEADIKRVHEVKDGLFRSTKWRRGLDPNQVVYIVHFHGVGYAPGVLPNEMQDSFVHTPSGKKSKFYAGKNQVRCIALYEQSEDEKTERDDIGNCFRYAVKCHYRPPSKKRMLELAPQWLLLTHMMQSNKKLTRTVGLRKPIKVICEKCNTVCDLGSDCSCESPVISTIVSDSIKKLKVDSSLIPPSNVEYNSTAYLNCSVAKAQNTWADRQEKKKLPILRCFQWLAPRLRFHGHMPVGP